MTKQIRKSSVFLCHTNIFWLKGTVCEMYSNTWRENNGHGSWAVFSNCDKDKNILVLFWTQENYLLEEKKDIFRCKQSKPYACYTSILVQWLQEVEEQGVFSLYTMFPRDTKTRALQPTEALVGSWGSLCLGMSFFFFFFFKGHSSLGDLLFRLLPFFETLCLKHRLLHSSDLVMHTLVAWWKY